MQIDTLTIPARDGLSLAARRFIPTFQARKAIVIISSATAVPQRYYKPFSAYLSDLGYTVITYDYRGIGKSRPKSLRGFKALAQDWTFQDMAGVVDWVKENYPTWKLIHIGHSYGGQTAGLLPNGDQIDCMVTFSSQSGYWRLQGGFQKIAVAFHVYFTLPILSTVFGYMPWSRIGSAEDLPKGVAIQWSGWCRRPGYLLDDTSLPLERFAEFKAPVLAYSFADDDWGTKKAVDAMMRAYPNLTRKHVVPAEVGFEKIGHFGFFHPRAKKLWRGVNEWLEQQLIFDFTEKVAN